MYRIALDAFGGDNAPKAVIDGCLKAMAEFDDISVTLCGVRLIIDKEIKSNGQADMSRITVIDAPEIIGMNEHPVNAIRRKKNSSLVKALEEVARGEADAVISGGSTGALLAGATLVVKRIKGIKRPALAPLLPTTGENPVMLIDCGANAECRASNLEQFALMGNAYMKGVMGVRLPRVGLLNIGAEAEKGDPLRQEAHKLLSARRDIKFAGNCEARDLLSGKYDVVVADGFSGNVALKLIEGTAQTLFAMIKQELTAGPREKVGAALAKPAFRRVKSRMDYTEYGGAMLLGINGGVIKTHGSSDAQAFYSCVKQAREFIKGGVVEKTRLAFADVNISESEETED